MAWTYSSSLPTDKDKVRFLVQDTDTNDQLIQDEEITFALTETGNIYRASALVARSIALQLGRQLTLVRVPKELAWDAHQQWEHYKELAKELEIKAASSGATGVFAGGISVADKTARENDSDRVQNSFTADLHQS